MKKNILSVIGAATVAAVALKLTTKYVKNEVIKELEDDGYLYDDDDCDDCDECCGCDERMRRYQSFEEPNQTWLPNHRNGKVILENKLFYIIVEDNEWAEAVELIQKESEYGDVDLSGLQKQHYRHYLDAIQDILLEQFGEVGIYTGPWTSGKITKGESNGSQCGTKGAA